MEHQSKSDIRNKLADDLLKRRQQALRRFTDKTHSLELVDTVNGVEYLDDGKSTSVNAAFESLRTVNQPVIWLVETSGNADYSKLIPMLQEKVKAIIAWGDGKIEMIDQLMNNLGHFMQTESIEEAVEMATICASRGDTVLFAPAAPAEDNQHAINRSQQFCDAVTKLS